MIESNEAGYIHYRDNGEIHLTVVLSKEEAATCNVSGQLIYRSDIMDMIRTRATALGRMDMIRTRAHSLGRKFKTEYVGPVMPLPPTVDNKTKMPPWASWWACHANGEAFWYEDVPFPDYDSQAWGYCSGRVQFAGHMPPPESWEMTRRNTND